jgi:hypothetical protein
MSTLLEWLQAVDPTISPAMAADLRACLVAISLELQRDDSSSQFRLSQWWLWLDEQGYDRDNFLRALSLLGRVRMDDADWALLAEDIARHGDDSEGLGWLLSRLEELSPDSFHELHSLQHLALAEEADLHQTAGGTSKLHRLAVDAGMFTVIYCYYQYRKGNQEAADSMKAQLEHKAAKYDQWMQELQQKGRVELRFARNDTRQASVDVIKAGMEHPQQTLTRLQKTSKLIFDNEKDIGNYTPEDVDLKVAKLVAEHTLAFLGKSVEDQAFVDLKATPAYQRRLATAVDKELSSLRPGVSIDRQALADRVEASLQKGDWFQGEKQKIMTSERFRSMWAKEQLRVKAAYKKMVEAEINIAKAEASNSESRFLEARVKYVGGNIIHQSNVVIDKDIVKIVTDAEDFARAADRAASRDATAVIEEL